MSALRTTSAALLVAAAYYGGTHVGLALTPTDYPISTLWPPNALLLAALLLAPRRMWPALVAAVLPVHLLVQLPYSIPVSTSVGWFLTNTGEALLGAACIRRVARVEQLFERFTGLLIFIAFGVVAAPVITSFADAGVVVVTGLEQDYWGLWRTRLYSNMLANLALVPPIVMFGSRSARHLGSATAIRYVEAATLLAALGVVTVVLFGRPHQSPISITALIYALLPVLLWAAVRFGPAGVSAAMLFTALLLIWNAIHQRGPFTSGSVPENVRSLQLFLGVLSVPMLSLAVVMQERVRAQALQSAVLASLHEQVAIIDRHGIVIGVNASWASAASHRGLSPLHEVQPGTNYLDVCRQSAAAGSDVAAHALHGVERLLNGSIQQFQLEYPSVASPNGRWFRMSGERMHGADGGAVIAYTDISTTKAAQIELERLRQELTRVGRVTAIAELSGEVAHQLNQPLTAIVSNAQAGLRVMAHEPADLPVIREVLDDIVVAGKRAGDVVTRFRGLMTPGEPQSHRVDVVDALSEMLDLVRSDIDARHVSVETYFYATLPPVTGDRIQLQQMFLNLLLNACDAMDAAPVSDRRLSIAADLTLDRSIHVRVADFGTGVRHHPIDRAFEPFVTTKASRLGLGLTICRSIVAAHGGRIWAANNADRGATFHVVLPAVDVLT